MIGEEGHLEGQERHDVVHALGERLGPARAPSPKLGRDVMDDGNARAAQLLRDSEPKAGGIDGHDDIGLEFACGSGGLVDSPDEAGQVGQHLGQAHERELVHGEQALEAVRGALRPADAGEANLPAGLGLQRAHQPACEVVAGGLA